MQVISLSSSKGNAFSLLATAKLWGSQMGLDTDALIADMQSSDYDHLVAVFKRTFEHVCEVVK